LAVFRFEDPYYLLLLGLVPLVAIWRRHRRQPLWLGASSTRSLEDLPRSAFAVLSRLLPVLKYGALCLMVIALARPQWGTREVSVQTEGINILLAVDLSESMSALDFQRDGKTVDRLEAAKGVIQDFIAKRTGDRIGLVVFGSEAYTQLPLTRDYDTLLDMLGRLEIGAAGKSTAIGDAIGISLKRLADIEGKSNIVILLTDGRSNAGTLTPGAAVEIAAQKEVKIYTVGIGGEGRAPFRVTIPGFGDRYVYQQVEMDEDALRNIAEKTGGLYFRGEDVQGLEKIYDTIDQLEKTEAVVKVYDNYRDLYATALLPAFGLLGLWILLVHTRFLRVP
jgi:Ca-activated chloride channel family protein